MIKSFTDKRTAALFTNQAVKGVPFDLRSPPGNNLEALKGDRLGQHSIRVNDQWRICFRFVEGDAFDVEFCDYH